MLRKRRWAERFALIPAAPLSEHLAVGVRICRAFKPVLRGSRTKACFGKWGCLYLGYKYEYNCTRITILYTFLQCESAYEQLDSA